jgi:hypothetical protein
MKNIIHKTHRDNMFATVSLYCLQDPRVSGLAKALHFYAISRPEGWVLRMEDLYRRFKEGRYAIRKAMKELEAAGYLVRHQSRTPAPDGSTRYGTTECEWYEESASSEQSTVNSDRSPDTDGR